ncbi:hypothetical protein D3C87_1641740 [compost metagenome]
MFFPVMPLYLISPDFGPYSPTNNLTNVVLPDPDGPTKATVSPIPVLKLIPFKAFVVADWCLNPTSSNANSVIFVNVAGLSGFLSLGIDMIRSKLLRDTSVSL